MMTLKVFNYQTNEYQTAILTPEQGDCSIGRSPSCDLVLESFDVSRVHAKIQMQESDYYLVDPGSANGCYLNGQTIKISQPHQLKIDDLIRIGDFVLLIEAISDQASDLAVVPLKNLVKFSQREWTTDINVRAVRIISETSDVKTLTFVAEPPVKFNYLPGQFVILNLEINGESVRRSYSISSTPSRPDTLEITVKRGCAPISPSSRLSLQLAA